MAQQIFGAISNTQPAAVTGKEPEASMSELDDISMLDDILDCDYIIVDDFAVSCDAARAELATIRAALAASQAREAGLMSIIARIVPVMSCDYEEDGSCVFCGNNVSKDHAPDCEYKLAEDAAIGALNKGVRHATTA